MSAPRTGIQVMYEAGTVHRIYDDGKGGVWFEELSEEEIDRLCEQDPVFKTNIDHMRSVQNRASA